MGYKIEADFEQAEKGAIIGIGFGLAVENGGSVEVDDETAALFKEETGKTVHEYFQKSKTIKVTTVASKEKGGDD